MAVRRALGATLITMTLAACGGQVDATERPATEHPDAEHPDAREGASAVAAGADPTGATATSRAAADDPATTTSGPAATTATAATTTTMPTAPTTAPTSDPVDDRDARDDAAAEAARLRAADLPGWTDAPGAHLDDPSGFDDPPAGCAYFDTLDAIGTTTARRASPTFTSPDGFDQLANQVTVYARAADARTALDTFDRPETPGCLEQILAAGGAGVRVSGVAVERRVLDAGDDGVTYRAELDVDDNGRSYLFVADLSYARVGRSLTFQMSLGYEAVAEETAPAFDVVVARLTDRFAG